MDEWICAIRLVVELMRRCNAPPTLIGMGHLHDHYALGSNLGFGAHCVVRAAANKRTYVAMNCCMG